MGGVAIVVFCDLIDSTALLARLGDDRMEGLRRTHMQDVADAVGVAGGRVHWRGGAKKKTPLRRRDTPILPGTLNAHGCCCENGC